MSVATPSPVRLDTDAGRHKACERVAELDGEWWVHFRKDGETRSQKQRRLMGMWSEEWRAWLIHYKGDAFKAHTKADIYNSFKWRCVLPRLIEKDTLGIWQMCEQRIIALNSQRAKLNFAGEWIHSNNLSTNEYASAMQEWEDWTRDEEQSDGRFQPTRPEFLYYEAMGK